jgi:prolyl-tRNA synthetase
LASVYKKIEEIIREEIVAVGGQEVFLPVLMPKSVGKNRTMGIFGDALMKLRSFW